MKILCVSLGCDKNLVDSENMLGLLRRDGYEFTDDEAMADVILINTCCFIGDAKEESVSTILEMAQWKKTGPCRALIVAGCMAQRYRQEIIREIPEVDAVLGTASYPEICGVLEHVLEGKPENVFRDIDEPPAYCPERVITTGGYYGFLKIAEGCNKRCTYCIIPSLRGRYRSVPMERLTDEARYLVSQGVKELILVAQETTLYGVDLYGGKTLPKLLRELCKISELHWIRLLYCYPEEITEELIDVIATEEKICHYLDLPIQHASDRILRRMGRKTTREGLRQIIGRLRERVPDIALRTTLISGFPGETEDDHEILMEFVNEMKFERLGVFTYSREEDTPAASFPDQVPRKLKEKRRDEIMELQQGIAFEKSESMVGKVLEVMIEGRIADEDAYEDAWEGADEDADEDAREGAGDDTYEDVCEDVYVGRTYMDAPGVDGFLFVRTDRELMSGDFIRVKVTGAAEYDLTGEVWDESAE